MALLNQSSLVTKKSTIFAKNTFAIVVQNRNPSKIKTLADLGNDKQKIVLCAPGVPCGVYANQVLRQAKVSISHPILSSDAAAAVSLVALGEADAALIYRTEAISNSRLKGIEIPKSENIAAQYPAAVIKNSSNKTAAREFVKFLNEPKAQKILSEYGFLPKAKL
jgi:molybdate transport system substrate-binding protein